MANVRIVLAQGLINGVNKVFATGEPYVPGTTAYILNGRIHNKALARGPENDYGYIELDPDAGTIEVDNAPLVDDVVQIFYWSRVVVPAPPIDRLTGVVHVGARMQGVVREVTPERLSGVVRSQDVKGVVREPTTERLVGTVGTKRIVGVIKEKCP
jgi:hypothetical protein